MVPAIFRLPGEILDEIIVELDDHKDLLSLALSSRSTYPLVVPRHTEYRIIRTRHTLPAVWAHLARRADLARYIRELHICDRADYSAPDHFPTTLVKSDPYHPQYDAADESTRVRNICLALSHMSRLRIFNWSWLTPPGGQLPASHFLHENAIVAAVVALPNLHHLRLAGQFALHAQNASVDIHSERYPGWNFANLTSLSLVGASWAKLGNSKHLLHLINRSPNLEYLEVPLNFSGLCQCRLPSLKRVRLDAPVGAALNTFQSPVEFFVNHPGIEELHWNPFEIVSLPPGCLPNLKTLVSTRQVFEALDFDPSTIAKNTEVVGSEALSGDVSRGSQHAAKPLPAFPIGLITPPLTPISASHPPHRPSVSPLSSISPLPIPSTDPVTPPSNTLALPPTPILRPIESLSITGLDPTHLLSHRTINRSTLKRVEFTWLGGLEWLARVAHAFPNIEWLKIPDIHLEEPGLVQDGAGPVLASSSTDVMSDAAIATTSDALSPPPTSPVTPGFTQTSFQPNSLSTPESTMTTIANTTPTLSTDYTPHPQPLPLIPLIQALSAFPRLHTLRTSALWKAVNYDPNKMHEVIRDVVGVCQNVGDLDYCAWYGKMGAFRRILIKREAESGEGERERERERGGRVEEKVSYAVVHPKIAGVWDVSKGLFR